MNTQQKTFGSPIEQMPKSIIKQETKQPGIGGLSDMPEDTLIIHEAKIITPQPYGVFALCKIIQYLQNN